MRKPARWILYLNFARLLKLFILKGRMAALPRVSYVYKRLVWYLFRLTLFEVNLYRHMVGRYSSRRASMASTPRLLENRLKYWAFLCSTGILWRMEFNYLEWCGMLWKRFSHIPFSRIDVKWKTRIRLFKV